MAEKLKRLAAESNGFVYHGSNNRRHGTQQHPLWRRQLHDTHHTVHHPMTIDLQDVQQLLAEVDRFARQRIHSATARPESPLAPAELEQLTQEATDLGILPLFGSEPGWGLWEQLHSAHAQLFNTGLLRQVACINAGVAFAWHRAALACAVARELEVVPQAPGGLGLTLLPTGHYGLARGSLARWLKGVPPTLVTQDPDATDDALLADWLNRSAHASVLHAPHGWQALLWPVWQHGTVEWAMVERHQLQVDACPAPHGLDEVAGYTVRALPGQASTTRSTPDAAATQRSRRLYQRVLKMDMLGMLAIGQGALLHAQAMAREYAGVRRQGGKTIGQHPAVQQLLAEIDQARQQADLALTGFALPIDTINLGHLCVTRISTHQALCHAASQVVQVHGGSGYMRDTGAEKILRDLNMLKHQVGGTREAPLFVAAWMEGTV